MVVYYVNVVGQIIRCEGEINEQNQLVDKNGAVLVFDVKGNRFIKKTYKEARNAGLKYLTKEISRADAKVAKLHSEIQYIEDRRKRDIENLKMLEASPEKEDDIK